MSILSESLTYRSLLRRHAYLGGRWVEAMGGSEFAVQNPANGELIAMLPDCDVEDLRLAIEHAAVVQKNWAERPAEERAKILRQWHDAMIAHKKDLALILTFEQGKPLREAEGEIDYAASALLWYAEEARRIKGEVLTSPWPDKQVMTIQQPIGVVAAITPWNFPAAMVTRKVAPALAAGCTVILKPAEETPLTALAIALLGEEAGIPDGVLNVITAQNPERLSWELTTHPSIRKISFTGSTEVGKILMRQAAEGVKKLSLELGGNAPFIIFEDADLDIALDALMQSKFRNAGQTCICPNRVFVHESRVEELTEILHDALQSLRVRPGYETGSDIGPLINARAFEKVDHLLKDAVGQGAEILCGGKRDVNGVHQQGYFFPPTLVRNVKPHMNLAIDEIFAPVISLISFAKEADVIKAANDTSFGLASYFFSEDPARIWRVAKAIESGMVGVNTGVISSIALPFGGVKQSGIGREGSHQGIEEYLETKMVCWGGMR